MLQAMGESTEYIDGLIQNANQSIYDAIDIKSFIDAENKAIGGEARTKLTKQLINANIWQQGRQIASEDYRDYLTQADAVIAAGGQFDRITLAKQIAKGYKQSNDKIRESTAESMIQTIEDGGIDAVNAMQAIATLQGKELTSADIESAYRAQISQITSAFDQLITGPGGIVTGSAKQILETLQKQGKASITALDANSAVINSITDIGAAYQEYYI